jgi:hypothetical protein
MIYEPLSKKGKTRVRMIIHEGLLVFIHLLTPQLLEIMLKWLFIIEPPVAEVYLP